MDIYTAYTGSWKANLVPESFTRCSPSRWRKILAAAGHMSPRIWEIEKKFAVGKVAQQNLLQGATTVACLQPEIRKTRSFGLPAG